AVARVRQCGAAGLVLDLPTTFAGGDKADEATGDHDGGDDDVELDGVEHVLQCVLPDAYGANLQVAVHSASDVVPFAELPQVGHMPGGCLLTRVGRGGGFSVAALGTHGAVCFPHPWQEPLGGNVPAHQDDDHRQRGHHRHAHSNNRSRHASSIGQNGWSHIR